MRSYVPTIFPGYTDDAISVKGSDDEDSINTDLDATYDEMRNAISTQAFMWPSSYASCTEVTMAVHAQALSVCGKVVKFET